MGFAARLQEATNHEAAQKGPVSQSVATNVITDALKKAVAENGLTSLYPPDGPRLAAVLAHLSQTFNMAAFCQRFKIPPLIAGDLMQVALYDVQLFIDDSGSMNEGDKWDDARAIVTQIVNITTFFDIDGIDVEFMNSPISGKRIKNPEEVTALFDQVRPCGFTPLASTCDRKILRPYFERISKLPPAEVKGMIIYCITDGAPTTERGMPTTITTYKMLEYIDQTLVSLKLPRKTIGFNVTQIGFDDAATKFLQELDQHPKFGDRIDAVSDYELEMVQCQAQGVYLTPDLYIVKLLVGAVDSSYDAHDDLDAPTDVSGGSAAFTSQRLKGVDRV